MTARGARGTPFAEIGSYGSLAEAADAIMELEQDREVFFSFELVVDTHTWRSDADALSCLRYQGKAHYYVVKRSAN